MTRCNDKWHLTFSDPPDMALRFKSDIRPVINVGGSNDYEQALNKPRINGVELVGNKTNEDLNISAISNGEIEDLLNSFK